MNAPLNAAMGKDDPDAFAERYREALETLDADAVLAFYRTPLPVIRPDRLRVIEDGATLRAELAKLLDVYRWAGMKRVAIAQSSVARFDPGFDLVSLTWTPLDAEGAEIARVDVTFALRATLDGARIAAVLAHNEERRRQPLTGGPPSLQESAR